MRRTYCAILAVWALSGVAGAQSGPAAKSAAWSGYYTQARGNDLQGFKPINPNWHELIVAHLQPWARAKMEATDGIAEDTGGVCKPDGIFRYPTQAGTFYWLPAVDRILIVWQAINTAGIQRVYLNRQHPKNLRPTWGGDSIGPWEGDTLVVDTIGFNERTWLNDAGAQHGDALRVVERIRPILGGRYLEYRVTADDPKALVKSYTYTRYYERVTAEFTEDVCQEEE